MSNQNTSHLGMWAISLMGLFVCFILFGTSFLLGDLVEKTLAPYFLLFIIAGAMALLPTIYVYRKVKKHMGTYKVEQVILFTAHLLIFTFIFRWSVLQLNAKVDMAVHSETRPLVGIVDIRVDRYDNIVETQYSVDYQTYGTVKHHEQNFPLAPLSELEKAVLQGNLNRAKYVKVELHKGLLGFDLVKSVELDFD